MSRSLLKRLSILGTALLALLFAAAAASAQEMVFQLDPSQSQVKFTLADVLHMVHGTFQLRSGIIHFNPSTGAASGSLVVDATSGDSGNKSRDKRMHRQILEDQKYPEIVFIPQHVSGNFNSHGSSQMELHGVMTMHGQQHEMTVSMPVQVSQEEASADVHFVVPYVKWGLKNPSTFILRVSDKVNIDVHAVGHLAQPAVDASRGSGP
jgi:polyisoprenoid-binding protein YceI